MEKDFEHLKTLIEEWIYSADELKEMCEEYLEKYCSKEGLVKYSTLINLIAKNQGLKID